MKKKVYIFLAVLISVCLMFVGCAHKYKDNIYLKGKQWKFTVKRTNSPFIDTMILNITEMSEKLQQKKCEWTLFYSDTNSLKKEDKSISMFPLTDNYISISSPSMGYFENSELVNPPSVHLPLYKGYDSESKTVHYSEDGDKSKSRTSIGKSEVIGKLFYNNPAVNDSCWEINETGISQEGTFRAKYYFHLKKGFVYLYYDFNDEQIEMNLVEVK